MITTGVEVMMVLRLDQSLEGQTRHATMSPESVVLEGFRVSRIDSRTLAKARVR